jgi:hypothetical protein
MNWSKINLWIAEGLCVLGMFCTALMIANPVYAVGLGSAIVVCMILVMVCLWFSKITRK